MGNRIQELKASRLVKKGMRVSDRGDVTIGYGLVYTGITVVTDTTVGTTTANALTGVSYDSTACGECEGLLTNPASTNAAFVSGVTVTDTTGEILIPITILDEYGNVQPVVLGSVKDYKATQVGGGQEFDAEGEMI
jgi:hypothetical protein